MKLPGWRNGLIELVNRIKAAPLVYGTHDCAVGLAFPAIETQIGLDLGAPFRGRYTSFTEGARLYQKAGFKTLAELVGHHLDECPVSQAQYGDIASMPSEHPGWCLGVVFRDHIGVIGPSSYEIVPNRLLALQTFRVK